MDNFTPVEEEYPERSNMLISKVKECLIKLSRGDDRPLIHQQQKITKVDWQKIATHCNCVLARINFSLASVFNFYY